MAKSKKKEYTNYAAMSAETAVDETPVVDEIVEEEVASEAAPEETVVEEPKPMYGVVTRCERLNVRNHPSTTAGIVTVLNEGTKVHINIEGDSAEWHYISTESGISGYCMARYIKIIEG